MDNEVLTNFVNAYLACLDLYGLGSEYFRTRYEKQDEFLKGVSEMFSPKEMDMYAKAFSIAPFTKYF